jgi:uncharacterized protein YpmB
MNDINKLESDALIFLLIIGNIISIIILSCIIIFNKIKEKI